VGLRVEDRDRGAVELPVAAEDLHRQPPLERHRGDLLGGVGLHAFALVDLEDVATRRLSDDLPEQWIDLQERGVRREELDARRVEADVGAHDDPVVEREFRHAGWVEEVHTAGLHEARADRQRRHAAITSARYGSLRATSSRSMRALTVVSTTSRRHRREARRAGAETLRERGLDLVARYGAERQRLDARADRLEQPRRGRRHEQQDRVDGGLLERLQQRDLGVLGEIGGVVDDDDALAALERPEREVLLHRADLLDADELRVGLPFTLALSPLLDLVDPARRYASASMMRRMFAGKCGLRR